MNSKKESAQGPASKPGRDGELETSMASAVQSIVRILTEQEPLAHMGEWATRTELAKEWQVDRATVTRRCKKAGVKKRAVVTKDNRLRVEFLMADVRTKLLGGAA